jgi:hypothetical protein
MDAPHLRPVSERATPSSRVCVTLLRHNLVILLWHHTFVHLLETRTLLRGRYCAERFGMSHRFESAGASAGQSGESTTQRHFQHFNDHPNRAVEASAVRSAADQVNTSSPEQFDAAVAKFRDQFQTVQAQDPYFFKRLSSHINTSFKPSSYGMASSEQLLGKPDA